MSETGSDVPEGFVDGTDLIDGLDAGGGAVCRELTCPHHGEQNRRKLVCDHPGIEHSPFSYTGVCPRCGVCKFIGHGPLCIECYDASLSSKATP